MIETRKLVDPRWIGPKGSELVIDVNSPAAESWIGIEIRRRFRGQNNGQFRYYGYFQFEKAGWQTLRMKPNDFENVHGEKLDDWHKVVTVKFRDAEAQSREHKNRMPKAGGQTSTTVSIPSNVSGWDSRYYHSTDKAFAAENVTATSSKVDRFRKLRWEGGEYIPRPKHFKKD